MTDAVAAAGAVNPEETDIANSQANETGTEQPQAEGQQPAEGEQGADGGQAKKADAAPAGQAPAEDDGKPRQWTRRDARIEQLLGDRRAMQAYAERTLAERQEIEKQALILPRPEDYRSDAEYMQAVANQAVTKAQAALMTRQVQEAQQRAADAAQQAWEERTSDFRARVPDFDTVAHNPDLKITPIMADAIRDSELGGEIAYYLGKNPNEAARIASLAPISQATAIARLETRVGKTSPSTTKAPAPVETALKGKSGGGMKSLEDMSFEEYRKARGF